MSTLSKTTTLLIILFLCFSAYMLYGPKVVSTLDSDSDHYISLAYKLAGLKEPQHVGKTFDGYHGCLFRSPGYPALLAGCLKFLPGSSIIDALYYGHLLVFLFTLLFISYFLKPIFKPYALLAGTAISTISMSLYASTAMTEWVTWCYLLIITAGIVSYSKNNNHKILYLCAFFFGLLITTRIEYLVFVTTFFLLYLKTSNIKLPLKQYSLLALVIAGTYLCFSLWKFSVCGKSYTKLFLGIAMNINTKELPAPSEKFLSAWSLDKFYSEIIMAPASRNAFENAHEYINSNGTSWDKFAADMLNYSLLQIYDSPLAYTKTLLLRWAYAISWVLPLIIWVFFARRRNLWEKRFSSITNKLFIAYFVHFLTISFINIMEFRYLAPGTSLILFWVITLTFDKTGIRLSTGKSKN